MRRVTTAGIFAGFTVAGSLLAGVLICTPASAETASAGGPPQFITYGLGAHPQEGDPDKRQAFYFSIPADFAHPLHVRLFDPDSGGQYDQITTRGPNTTTRFTVFGGRGADASRFARPERISHQEETQGTRLLQREFRAEPEFDDAWMTLGSVMPEQGELVDGRYVFRLLVHGLRGHDGNVFDFAISLSDTENVAPEGLRVYTYGPTTRTPIEGMITELRFRIPQDAESLTVGTFDAAAAEILLTQQFQSYPLAASGQNQWETTSVLLATADRGTFAAITLQGGEEVPNDATYYVMDQARRLIPFELPVRLIAPRRRPVVAGTVEYPESCVGVRFDASGSSDPEGGQLTYRWRFGDGRAAAGPSVTHVYEIEGRITAWLEVSNESARIGNGAAMPLSVYVKHPPIPRSTTRPVIAVDEETMFDGSASSATLWDIVRHEWRISDGTVLTGERPTHVFRAPGTYRITHIVQDNSEHRCDTAREEFEVRVNAPPVAQAGPDQLVTASVVQFDGSASHDPDGDTIIRYDWDFGDGNSGAGPGPAHIYVEPGTYDVRLTVTDSAGTLRNTGSDTMQVIVNARPIADAGPELVGAPGQTLTFDGSRSLDPDGEIVEYLWDFRDGNTARGARVTHAFAGPGVYAVRLTVKDDTGHEEAVDFAETRVFINPPPVAWAGPELLAAPGDEVKLSGALSFSPNGRIGRYRWDFSDLAEPLYGTEVTRRFEQPGIYTAKLTITDDSGAHNASASAETRILVNHAPVAHAGENIDTNETTIRFDGTKSVDADGDPLTYRWNFGDGATASGARVAHTYREGGHYQVALTVDDGKGLHNSESRHGILVRIDRAPVAVAGENRQACTGDVLAFDGSRSRDPEGGVLRYLWEFGDGTRAEIVNPSKSYRQGGLYPVTLTVRDDSGMAQNLHTDRISVRIDQGPVAAIRPREILACTGSEVAFDGSESTDVDGVVNSFRWDFGDGSFGAGGRPTHIYEKPGNFRAFLTITGEQVGNCSNTSSDEIPVRILAGPVAAIQAPAAVPVTEPVAFDGSGSRFGDGRITGWRWDFGDGNGASGAQVTHQYAKAGTYRVTLTVTSDSDAPSCQAVSSRHLVTVNDPPQASFTAKPLVAVGEEMLFDGSASRDPDGSIVGYEWDFGDGNKGSGVTVRHRYQAPGSYKATLMVRDDAGLPNSTATIEQVVRVNAAPVADAGPARVAAPGERIAFDGSRSTDADGSIVEYVWDFGDGRTASGKAVTHAFAKPGVYAVRLRVKDDSGHPAAFGFHEALIVVNDPPVANAGPELSAGPGDEVKFSAARSFDPDGGITSYRWEFSDGAEPMTGAEVTRRFDKPGIHTAKLTVTDDSGAINATASAETRVLVNHAPVAVAGENVETNILTVNFDGAKSSDADGDTLSYAWDFGDGNKASGVRAIHTYREGGTYQAALTVNDGRGLHNSESRHAITVRIDRAPVAVAGDNRSACTGEVLAFDGSRSRDPEGGMLRYLWDFGDGTKSEAVNPAKSYRQGGHYPVTLTVRDDSGMAQNEHTARVAVQIDQGPVAAISPREVLACTGGEVSFDGSKSTDVDGMVNSFSWDFGDGGVSTSVRPTHIFHKTGDFRVYLTISGEKVGKCSDVSTDAIPVRILAAPLAAIQAPAAVPVTAPVPFDGSASHFGGGKITGWRWDFGDGNGASGAKVSHKYAKAGVYRVTLTITSDSTAPTCRAASIRHIVTVNEPPQASFTTKPLVAVGEEVLFDGAASRDPDGSIVGYEWDFGDGNKASGVTVRHRYQAPGLYKATLTVRDDAGLANSAVAAERAVRVNAAPVADAGPARVAAPGERIAFDGSRSTDADGSISEYVWDFGDGRTASGKAVTHTFAKPGSYAVRLRVKDNSGHPAGFGFHEARVVVNDPPVANAGPEISAGPGDEVKLSAARSFDPDGRITSYRWEFSDGAEPMTGAEVTRRFDKPGIHTAKLTVTDDSGAINAESSAETRIAVNHAPVANAGENVETNSLTVNFDGAKSTDADGDTLTYAWDFGDGNAAQGVRAIHTYRQGGLYPVVLVVNDGRGLHNSESRHAITVRIDRAPVAVAGGNQQACTGDILLFDGSQSVDPEGGVLRYLWDFGDGTRAEVVNPTKSYRQGGHYPVTLTVRDDSGMERNEHTDRVAVQIDQGPVATAAPREIMACTGNQVVFDGSKSTDVDGVVNNFRWDFGDGNFGAGERATHFYERPGNYRAFLTITGEKVGNCSNTSTDEVAVRIIAGPVAVIAAPDAAPVTDTIPFDGSASQVSDGRIIGWRWDFGDGSSASGAQVTHRYAKAGVYRVTLTITSDSASPTCRAVSARRVITVNAPPVAAFQSKEHVATDEEVVFDAGGSQDPDGGIVAYEWDFGDGGTGSGVTVRHKYREPGTYPVRLTVRDNAGLPNSATTIEQAVRVNAPPAPVIEGPAVACAGETVAWDAGRSSDADGPIRSFRWTFGDGNEAAAPAVSHRYARPGRYSMTLYADDGTGLGNGQRHTTRTVWVNQPPVAAPGPDRMVCPGETVRFDGSASTDADGRLARYLWDFGDGTTQEGAAVEHRFERPGTYQVRLTVTDDSGSSCASNSASLRVLVKAPPVASAGGDREVWVGGANDAVLLDGSQSRDPDGHALAFAWQIGDGTSVAGERVRYTIPLPGEYQAKLVVSGSSGLSCGTASDSFRIIARERK